MNQLDALKLITTVVADTGDFRQLGQLQRGIHTNRARRFSFCQAVAYGQAKVATEKLAEGDFWGQSPNATSLWLALRVRCFAALRNWCLTPITTLKLEQLMLSA